jgi:hypothetical protein
MDSDTDEEMNESNNWVRRHTAYIIVSLENNEKFTTYVEVIFYIYFNFFEGKSRKV